MNATLGFRDNKKGNFNCEYTEVSNIKSTETPTKSMPRSNRPIKCQNCDVILWSYNHSKHFESDLPNELVPHGIPEKERKMVVMFACFVSRKE